jgi:hypothetical protein
MKSVVRLLRLFRLPRARFAILQKKRLGESYLIATGSSLTSMTTLPKATPAPKPPFAPSPWRVIAIACSFEVRAIPAAISTQGAIVFRDGDGATDQDFAHGDWPSVEMPHDPFGTGVALKARADSDLNWPSAHELQADCANLPAALEREGARPLAIPPHAGGSST